MDSYVRTSSRSGDVTILMWLTLARADHTFENAIVFMVRMIIIFGNQLQE